MDKRFITNISGKEFVLFEGLLNEFHKNGGKSIRTEIINQNPLIIHATVEGEKGTFQGIGDANPENVNSMIARHSIRMAETRAIARALRWYNNIGMCSADELGGDPIPKTGVQCDACKGSNVKHLKGVSKVGKPYDFYMCNDCEFKFNI
jgi:hypothetical protein